MHTLDGLRGWVARHPDAVDLATGLGLGLVCVAVSLLQWGPTSDGLFRGVTLGAWIGLVVVVAARIRRRRSERLASDALEQRLRIARELHDTVAGAVAAIGIQAAAARRVLERDPGQAAAALERIEVASRAANEDLRRMLRALRDGGPAPVEREVGLAALGALVADTHAAGVQVRLELDPAALELGDPAVDHAAYRIVQEALSNVLRHAGPVPVEVVARVDGGAALDLAIVNGPGPVAGATGGAGLGIVGMRERAARLGGTVDAGPTESGGFGVRAHFPLGRPRSGDSAADGPAGHWAGGGRRTDSGGPGGRPGDGPLRASTHPGVGARHLGRRRGTKRRRGPRCHPVPRGLVEPDAD